MDEHNPPPDLHLRLEAAMSAQEHFRKGLIKADRKNEVLQKELAAKEDRWTDAAAELQGRLIVAEAQVEELNRTAGALVCALYESRKDTQLYLELWELGHKYAVKWLRRTEAADAHIYMLNGYLVALLCDIVAAYMRHWRVLAEERSRTFGEELADEAERAEFSHAAGRMMQRFACRIRELREATGAPAPSLLAREGDVYEEWTPAGDAAGGWVGK